jgi:beclin
MLLNSINKDKIGEASIRMPSMMGQDDDTWTRALRHMLLTIKVLMSWVVNNVNGGEDRIPSSQARAGKGKRRE